MKIEIDAQPKRKVLSKKKKLFCIVLIHNRPIDIFTAILYNRKMSKICFLSLPKMRLYLPDFLMGH